MRKNADGIALLRSSIIDDRNEYWTYLNNFPHNVITVD